MAEAVIGGPFVGVAEGGIGLVDLLELGFGISLFVAVGVVLEGQFAEGLLEFFIGGAAGYAQHLVVITFYGHRRSTSLDRQNNVTFYRNLTIKAIRKRDRSRM